MRFDIVLLTQHSFLSRSWDWLVRWDQRFRMTFLCVASSMWSQSKTNARPLTWQGIIMQAYELFSWCINLKYYVQNIPATVLVILSTQQKENPERHRDIIETKAWNFKTWNITSLSQSYSSNSFSLTPKDEEGMFTEEPPREERKTLFEALTPTEESTAEIASWKSDDRWEVWAFSREGESPVSEVFWADVECERRRIWRRKSEISSWGGEDEERDEVEE